MDKIDLKPHPEHPMLPEQAVSIKPDTGCQNCPLAQHAGHKTCSTFSMVSFPPVTNNNRIDISKLRELQGRIHDLKYWKIGAYRSNYNALRQYNFDIVNVFKLVSASGKNLTLEVIDGSGNPAQIVETFWRERDPEFGMFWINGFVKYTAISPNDIIYFGDDQIISSKLTAKVKKIVSCSGSQIVVEVDKDCSFATHYYSDIAMEDLPEYATATVLQYGKEAEDWAYVEEPHFFYGKKIRKDIKLSDIPVNGVYVIENDVIAPPETFDPLDSNFIIEGYRNGGWETINDLSRLNIKPTLSTFSFKTEQPAGSIQPAPMINLTVEYERFRVWYWKKTTIKDSSCSFRGFDRCFHSGTDFSHSGYTGPGIIDDTTKKRFCRERIYTTFNYIDDFDRISNAPGNDGIPDRVEAENHHPTGLVNYPTDGACIQYGYCDKFANAVGMMSDNRAPFMIDYKIAKILKELWFASDFKTEQVLAGYPYYFITRLKHPSIMNLIGSYAGLTSAIGMHPTTNINEGGWSFTEPVMYTDDDGNQRLTFQSGFERAFNPFELGEQVKTAKTALQNIPQFTKKREILNPGNTNYADDLLTTIGCAIERDTGQLIGQGLESSSFMISPMDFLIPKVSLGTTSPQVNTNTEIIFNGSEINIKILPLRQDQKGEIPIGSRTIDSCSGIGGGLYKIELVNEPVYFSIINSGDPSPGDSFDEIFSVKAGGSGNAIAQYEWQVMQSYHAKNKYLGDRKRGAWAGDSVEIDGKRYLIHSVEPAGGSEASGWGERNYAINGEMLFTSIRCIYTDGDYAVSLMEVKDQGNDDIFTIVDGIKPASIPGKTVWFDGYQNFYISPADAGKSIAFTYININSNSVTEYAILSEHVSLVTQLDYSEYSGADNKKFFFGFNTATVVSGNPAKNQVLIEDQWGKVKITVNVRNLENTWKLLLEWDDEAVTPTDGWCLGNNFLSWGKKRDIVTIYDENGWIPSATLEGEAVQFYKRATVFKPKTHQLEIAEHKTDDFEIIPSPFYEVESAGGKIRIKSEFVSQLDPAKTYCFRLKEIEFFDHRGHCSAALLNATEKVISEIKWLSVSLGNSRGGSQSWGRYYYGGGSFVTNPDNNCEETDYISYDTPPAEIAGYNQISGNKFAGIGSTWQGNLTVGYASGGGFGIPYELRNLPDGCTIVSAKAELTSGGLQRYQRLATSEIRDCNDNIIMEFSETIKETLTGLSVNVLGFNTKDDGEIISSLSIANPNHTEVQDVTGLMKTLYEISRTSDFQFGFGFCVFPEEMGDVESLKQWVGARPPSIKVDYCEGENCNGYSYTKFYTEESFSITWSLISISNIFCEIKFPDDYKTIIQPRFPSMVNL